MKTQKSKIDGVGIVELRCEACYGSIMPEDGAMALIVDGAIHFVHSVCYEEMDGNEIMKKIKNISDKTKNDGELFELMEN